MAETAKIPKSVVLYIHKRNTLYRCRDCVLAKAMASRCALFGAVIPIKPIGTCGEWLQRKGNMEVPFIGGYTKEQVGYIEVPEGYSCAHCDEFLPEHEDCKKVDKDSPGDDPGKIVSGACCNRWEQKDS
jgi:hypothetical protein